MLSLSFVVVGHSKRCLRKAAKAFSLLLLLLPIIEFRVLYPDSRFKFRCQNAIASTPVLRPLRRRVDEGKDEEDDEPVGVGIYSFSKVETDDADNDADADDDADDDGK